LAVAMGAATPRGELHHKGVPPLSETRPRVIWRELLVSTFGARRKGGWPAAEAAWHGEGAIVETPFTCREATIA